MGWIAPGTAEFWASIGAIWRDMLLAEALVCSDRQRSWRLLACEFLAGFIPSQIRQRPSMTICLNNNITGPVVTD